MLRPWGLIIVGIALLIAVSGALGAQGVSQHSSRLLIYAAAVLSSLALLGVSLVVEYMRTDD